MKIISDRYSILNKLGQGGSGITYAAIDKETEQQVAIKALSLTGLDNWKKIELFEREAKILQQLNHPAIPRYIDYFDIETARDKAFYIVQQQAPGKSLAQLVESGWRSSEEEVKKIAQQVLEILSYLHSLDPPVIHRDIKPNNIIYSDDGKIYLVDFGAVQNTYYNTLMQGSTVVGTYGYMAPEQFRGQALPATDLYSLGATLLYLLTHRSPAELPQDTLKLDVRNSVDISESFADWLDKILEPDIEDRFANAEVALEKLFASKIKKNRKLINRLGIGVLALGLIVGVNSYKWFFLSRLGFYPSNICSDTAIIKSYLNQDGIIDIIPPTVFSEKSLLNCVIESNTIEINAKKDIINILMEKGFDINAQHKYNQAALFIASSNQRHLEIVKLLIENGADINIQNKYGETPLFKAALKENIEIVKLLIENGADINIQDKYGETPLFKAALKENIEIVNLLIKSGAYVNFKNKYGETPLFRAALKENIEIVNLLIESGADTSALDYKTIIKTHE